MMGSTLTMAEWLKDVTIGNERIVCAIIMAAGVYSMAKKPSGPLLDNSRYTKRPTTTGGSPMKVLSMLMINPLSGNFLNPRSALKGRPIRVAARRAVPDTLRERRIIPSSSLSRLRIR
jgi:hypothetical protein